MVLAFLSFQNKSTRQYNVLLVIFLLLYTAFLSFHNIPNRWWYYAIYFPLFSTYIIAFGIFWLIRHINRKN